MVEAATAIAAYKAAKAIIEGVGVAKTAASKFDKWYGNKPSPEDAKEIVAYCKHIDERRVFFFSSGDEQIGSCLWSLNEVRQATIETKAKIEHPGIAAFLGAALDAVRAFLDKWVGFGTDRRDRRHLDSEHAFFADLGDLRSKMRTYVAMFATFAPKAKAPNLFKEFIQDV